MKRQKLRKMFLIVSMLLFPVTLYYFSPALVIEGALRGVINGSFIVFAGMLFLAIPFGRVFCAYLCPAGGLQECLCAVNPERPKQGWRNTIKYVIWAVWVAVVAVCYINRGEIVEVDFFFETMDGISVANLQSYIIYYGILLLIFVPAVWCGKRTFCHYFCWMAPFMALGMKIRRALHLPGLHIRSKDRDACTACGKCDRECPMGIMVSEAAARGQIDSAECIQCGVCIDGCPRKVLSYGWKDGRTSKES